MRWQAGTSHSVPSLVRERSGSKIELRSIGRPLVCLPGITSPGQFPPLTTEVESVLMVPSIDLFQGTSKMLEEG